MNRAVRLLMLGALLLSPPASAASLTVFAASSLSDAFKELGQLFTRQTGQQVDFQFAGSQILRTQLEQGAPADVVASANTLQYQPLVAAGLVEEGKVFVRNRLALVAPMHNQNVNSLADLAKPGAKLIIADNAVPAGNATLRMLKAIDAAGLYGPDFSQRVLKNVVSKEQSVRQVALKVQLGEADAALIYFSDLTPELKTKVRLLDLPSRFNQATSYLIGATRTTEQAPNAQAFVKLARSAEGQKILHKWGFLTVRSSR